MGEYAFNPDYLTFDIEGILINIIAPLIIVIIGDVLLVGQLKTANEATHADEYCGELDLTEKHDTFQPHRDHRCHERRQGRLSNPTNTTRPLTRKEDHHGTS